MLVIKVMYEDASTEVRINGRESKVKAFNLKVGVHQGSVLCPTAIHYRVGGFV